MRFDPVIDLQAPTYTPIRFLDKTAEHFGVKNDAELARVLGCTQALLCKIRYRKTAITAWLMVRVMDRTDWPVKRLRELAGVPFAFVPPEPKPRRKQPVLKLTDAQVREVRDSKQPVSLTAELYDISERYVQLIQSGKARREVGVVRA